MAENTMWYQYKRKKYKREFIKVLLSTKNKINATAFQTDSGEDEVSSFSVHCILDTLLKS